MDGMPDATAQLALIKKARDQKKADAKAAKAAAAALAMGKRAAVKTRKKDSRCMKSCRG